VATAYIVLGWVVVQVTSEAVPALHLPEWVNSLVFYLGLIGFPFVMLFAWAFELTPEGIKPEREVDRSVSITSVTGKKLNTITIGLLVVALAYFIYESRIKERVDVLAPAESTELVNTETSVSETEPLEAELSTLPGASIAVLPFENMTGDSNKEFFSDGISEEILNVLAQIPNLHVTSRSSAFAFKGGKINISEVAQKLGVDNVLEGSVRMDGNQVRITAQLIEAETDRHLWSATYDRELKSIFAIQDEISAAIVEALKGKLGLEEAVEIVHAKVVDLEAHQAYLKGRFYLEKRNVADLDIAMAEFDKALDIEPGYAQAMIGKARTIHYLSESNYGELPMAIVRERATKLLDMAELLDPSIAEIYALRGTIHSDNDERDIAHQYFDKAIAINPNFAVAYSWYGNSVSVIDEPEKRFELRQKAYQLDPLNILTGANYAYSHLDHGRIEEALKLAAELNALNPDSYIPHIIKSAAYDADYQYALATSHMEQAFETSTSMVNRFNLSTLYSRLGLNDRAAGIYQDTELDFLSYWFMNNFEQSMTVVRQKLPRAETDGFGNYLRGLAEAANGDYRDAIGFLERGGFCQPCINMELTWVYKFSNEQQFNKHLAEQKTVVQKANGAQVRLPEWAINPVDLALLSDEVDLAVKLFAQKLIKGYIIDPKFFRNQYYQDLRDHPEWQNLVASSEKNRLKELALYQKLVAKESDLETVGRGT
jgi:TolB-like protein